MFNVEEKYSVRNKFHIILDNIKLPFADEYRLLNAIDEWNTTDRTNMDILNEYLVILFDESRKRPIQDLGTRLGYRLGASSPIEAIGMGASLLKLLDGYLHKIDDELEIHSKYRLNRSTFKQLYRLHYLPPMLSQPEPWSSNSSGGWISENKKVILGKGNYHEYPQGLDALNKLQTIQWELDTTVLVTEECTHPNIQRFNRIINDYIDLPFYFVWRFDKRGRSYSQGWDINLQGDEYTKACLSMHEKEVVTNLDALKIAIANHAGLDRNTFKERLDWFDSQTAFDTKSFNEPVLGRKAIKALKDTAEGKPTGYWMSMDATASGLQIMAALSGCKTTAKACNLINDGKRHDLYQEIADSMNTQLAPEDQVTRALIKKPIMTRYYNSEAVPKQSLNKKQLKVFNSVLKGEFTGAEDVMKVINKCWSNNVLKHSWTLPDGHVAYIRSQEMVDATVEIEGMSFPYRYLDNRPSDQYRSLAPNIIHSIDGYIAREMVRRAKYKLAHIHDCFVFHPNYLEPTLQLYREILAEIADMDLLASILSEITGKAVLIQKDSNDLGKDILASQYALS